MIKVADDICVEHYVPFTCTPSVTISELQTRCIFPNFDTNDDLPRNPCRNVVHHLFVLPQDHYRLFHINGHSRMEVPNAPSAYS